MKPPAFQFYVDNFVEGTSDFTPAEVGCYIRLLCHQWTRGQIPSDPERLKMICGVEVSDHVLHKFNDGKNRRLENEREKQLVWREKSRIGGVRSGESRRTVVQPPLEPPYEPNTQPKGNTPSPVSSLQSPTPATSLQTPSPNGKVVAARKASRPGLDEVRLVCAKAGLPESDADWFWNKCEANGWRNGGKAIVSWTHTVAAWRLAGYFPSLKQGRFESRPKTAMDLKTIIQSKEVMASQIRLKFCSDTAIDSVWSNPQKKQEFFNLKREIKNLNSQISSMA